MKRLFLSAHLAVMLLVSAVLAGFSYAWLPGRHSSELDAAQVRSIAVDSNEGSGYTVVTDPALIQTTADALKKMNRLDDTVQRGYTEQTKWSHFTIRVSFKDNSTRTYFGDGVIGESTYTIRPLYAEGTFQLDKADLEPLLQQAVRSKPQ